MYYGDAVGDSAWTDNVNYTVSSSMPRQANIAGDGKFDQSYLGYNYVQELQVYVFLFSPVSGRISYGIFFNFIIV